MSFSEKSKEEYIQEQDEIRERLQRTRKRNAKLKELEKQELRLRKEYNENLYRLAKEGDIEGIKKLLEDERKKEKEIEEKLNKL